MKNIILGSFDPFLYDHINTIDKAKELIGEDNIKIAVGEIRIRETFFSLKQRGEIIESYGIEPSSIIIIKNKEELREVLRTANKVIKPLKNFDKKLMQDIGAEFGINNRLEKTLHFMDISQSTTKVSAKKVLEAIYNGSSYNAMKDYINEFTYNEIRRNIEEKK